MNDDEYKLGISNDELFKGRIRKNYTVMKTLDSFYWDELYQNYKPKDDAKQRRRNGKKH